MIRRRRSYTAPKDPLRRMIWLEEEHAAGRISDTAFRDAMEEASRERSARQELREKVREVDRKYSSGRKPVTQGGLPSLGKKRP
jgi:hypothetical protein